MTCQIRSDGTCSECKHNSECSDDIFQAVFLLGKISRVTAQPESHGSQLHNGERRHTHTHTHTETESEEITGILIQHCRLTPAQTNTKTAPQKEKRQVCTQALHLRIVLFEVLFFLGLFSQLWSKGPGSVSQAVYGFMSMWAAHTLSA